MYNSKFVDNTPKEKLALTARTEKPSPAEALRRHYELVAVALFIQRFHEVLNCPLLTIEQLEYELMSTSPPSDMFQNFIMKTLSEVAQSRIKKDGWDSKFRSQMDKYRRELPAEVAKQIPAPAQPFAKPAPTETKSEAIVVVDDEATKTALEPTVISDGESDGAATAKPTIEVSDDETSRGSKASGKPVAQPSNGKDVVELEDDDYQDASDSDDDSENSWEVKEVRKRNTPTLQSTRSSTRSLSSAAPRPQSSSAPVNVKYFTKLDQIGKLFGIKLICDLALMNGPKVQAKIHAGSPEDFRFEPIGEDSEGHSYWYFDEIPGRLFKELPKARAASWDTLTTTLEDLEAVCDSFAMSDDSKLTKLGATIQQEFLPELRRVDRKKQVEERRVNALRDWQNRGARARRTVDRSDYLDSDTGIDVRHRLARA